MEETWKIWRRKWQPTPLFLPRKSHGQRSLERSTGSQRVYMPEHACTHVKKSNKWRYPSGKVNNIIYYHHENFANPDFSLMKNFYNWSIADLQCCVNVCCAAKWFSYTHAYIYSFIFRSFLKVGVNMWLPYIRLTVVEIQLNISYYIFWTFSKEFLFY